MSKSIKELLETLEEPYRGQALANQSVFHHNEWNKSRQSKAEAVIIAFDWESSKEKFDYWDDFCDELESKGL